MSVDRVPAVILAGGKPGDPLAEAMGIKHKALVPVAGRPMVAHIVNALANARSVSEVSLVGPAEVAAVLPQVRHIEDTGTFLGNIAAGVSAYPGASCCLVITSDIPFITGEILDAFVEQGLGTGADLVYPIVPVALCQQRYPNMRRTSLRVREGRFTGGNAVLMRPDFLRRNASLIEEAFAARKQPFRLISMVGWGVVARLMLSLAAPGVLPIGLLEERIGRLVGGRVAAANLPYPEIGADVDKPEDLLGLSGAE